MSNEYKDWMIDRVSDLEWSLARATIALQAYADTDTEQYKILNSGQVAKEALVDIDERIDFETIFEEWDHEKYK